MWIRLAVVMIAAALAGCAQLAAQYTLSDLSRTQVLVADGYIVLGQEPLIVRRTRDGRSEDTVTWTIGTRGVLFAERDAITVDAFVKPLQRDAQQRSAPARDVGQVGQVKCETARDRTEVSCRLPRTLKSGFYAYTVRVTQGGRALELDPTIMLD
jgi:hypothetical protein